MYPTKHPSRHEITTTGPHSAGGSDAGALARRVLAVSLVCVSALLAPAPAPAAHLRRPALAHASVIGGSAARPGSFAAVADIYDSLGRHGRQCTGTVVAPNLILTAGHCAEDLRTGHVSKPSGFRVLTGGVRWSDPSIQISGVSAVLVYEGFARAVDDGDAALLVLSTPTTVMPMAIASSAAAASLTTAGAPATIAGWGITHARQQRASQQLRWAATVLQSRRWCASWAPPFFADELCAIDPPRYRTGGCEGDSGGPLIAAGEGGEPVEIGIAIHVYGGCSTHRATVFTRVASIAPWIQSWIDAYRVPPAPVTPPVTPPATPPGTPASPVS